MIEMQIGFVLAAESSALSCTGPIMKMRLISRQYRKHMIMQITLVAIWHNLLVSNVVPWAVILQVLLLRPLVTMTENSYSVLGFSPETI